MSVEKKNMREIWLSNGQYAFCEILGTLGPIEDNGDYTTQTYLRCLHPTTKRIFLAKRMLGAWSERFRDTTENSKFASVNDFETSDDSRYTYLYMRPEKGNCLTVHAPLSCFDDNGDLVGNIVVHADNVGIFESMVVTIKKDDVLAPVNVGVNVNSETQEYEFWIESTIGAKRLWVVSAMIESNW